MDVSSHKMLQNIQKTDNNPVPWAHKVGIVYFTVCARLFRFASKITMFAFFVVENPCFLFHFMTDNGCIFT